MVQALHHLTGGRRDEGCIYGLHHLTGGRRDASMDYIT